MIINIGGIGTEIVKNLVLGGINTIELLDSSTIKEEDFASQFFLPNDDSIIGKTKLPVIIDKIMDLNKRVNLSINTTPLEAIEESYFLKFDLILGTELEKYDILRLNGISRKLKIPLYVAGLHGMFGYILTDLIEHESVSEKDSGNQLRIVGSKVSGGKTITDVKFDEATRKETVTVLDEFCSLENVFGSEELPKQLNRRQLKKLSSALPLIFALFELGRREVNRDELHKKVLLVCDRLKLPTSVITEEYLQKFVNQAYTEFSPVAAILGGTLAQDVIQYLSRRESPINNVLVLDSLRSEMPIYLLT